jgi:Leucine-rich repeat (LRR) protein
VRKDDPSILPKIGKPFKIRQLSEKEGIELADALLENTNVTYLELETENYTKCSAEAMAKYVRTSKCLERMRCNKELGTDDRVLQSHEEILCCLLPAIQESTSLKELHMELPRIGGPSSRAFENMLEQTQSLLSLTLIYPEGPWIPEDVAMAPDLSGLKNNTTLRELTLEVSRGAMAVSPILTSLRDHPLLRRLCLRGYVEDLTGLETVLLSETSKITELDIDRRYTRQHVSIRGLTWVLRALAYRPMFTELGLRYCPLTRDEVGLLQLALRSIPSLQTLNLVSNNLGSDGLAELAPAFYHNTSIKELDISHNNLNDVESAEILRGILRSNKTITTLVLSGNHFGETTGAVECIADGLGSNSTLLNIDLSRCFLRNGGVSILAQTLGSRNTTIKKLTLDDNFILSGAGVGALLDTSSHITDLDLQHNFIGNDGASLLARSLENNALPNLTRLYLSDDSIGDDGFIALILALKQNTSLLQLDLRYHGGYGFNERTYVVLAESLPEIKVLQQLDIGWGESLASAMPLLLAGLRKNTSLFRFNVSNCAPSSVPPTFEETTRCAGGWMQEMERFGHRNRFLPLIRAPNERLPPRGVWPRALALVATLPDVLFGVLRSKPSLVPSEDARGKEVSKDTGVPKKASVVSVVTSESYS